MKNPSPAMLALLALVTPENAAAYHASEEKLSFLCDLSGFTVDDPAIRWLENRLEQLPATPPTPKPRPSMILAKRNAKHSKRCNFAWRSEIVEEVRHLGIAGCGPKDSATAIRVDIGQHTLYLSQSEAEALALRLMEQAKRNATR